MIYFIPAWYKENTWCEREQPWYRRRTHTEFDDTVKHIQLFNRSRAYPYCVLLLGFTPNLRHFLHRQGVYHAPYWSCFDAMQEIGTKKVRAFSFRDIKWPEDIEFIYSPFAVIAELGGEKFAQIEFGEDGNLIEIDMYQDGRIARKNIYDDRGFVASTIVYDENGPLYQDYLMENGIFKLRCYRNDGHVEINANHPEYLLKYRGVKIKKCYERRFYNNIEEVIEEVFRNFLSLTCEHDLFCVAVHDLHAKLLEETLKNRKLILSFFENRFDTANQEKIEALVEASDYMIADSKENSDKLAALAAKKKKRIANIIPYDSRADFGISRQIPVQKILIPIDNMDMDTFRALIGELAGYLKTNEHAMVHLFTRLADYNHREGTLILQVRTILRESGFDERLAMDAPGSFAENALDEEEVVTRRFFVEQCVDELSVSKCMREQRIVVDMRERPELYLQITSISMGIPQIVKTQTPFVWNGKNGRVIADIKEVRAGLAFYLESMNNWNDALVYAYELGQNYTTEKLLEKWKEVIDFVG